MTNIKLVLTRTSEHKSIQDALGEAKHFVSLPRLVSKNEQELIAGKPLVIRSNDPARRNIVQYEVQVLHSDQVKPVLPVVEAPKVAEIPEMPSNNPQDLSDEELRTNYAELRDEMTRREFILGTSVTPTQGIQVSKARQQKRRK